MKPQAHQSLVDQLTSSESALLSQLDGLTPAQWNFRESPGRWTIAENLEHLTLFEDFIRATIRRTLEATPEPDKKSAAPSKDQHILSLATSRSTKIQAREIAQPKGCRSEPTVTITLYRETCAKTIAFVSSTEAPLRDHFFPHLAFGDIDCYQWLTVLSQHTLRHVAQIEQIKADPAYPVS